jgi:hypothetical protein
MPDLAQLGLKAKGGEARLRALLEDLIEYYKGVYSGQPLALAVWFARSEESSEQNLLVLFDRSPLSEILLSPHQSLVWKTGLEAPPFANIHCTSVDYFTRELGSNPESLAKYFDRSEVLYFDKRLLPAPILQKFTVITEPAGLMKGWYVSRSDYDRHMTVRQLLGPRQQLRPAIGLVKTAEGPDSESCRGLIHVEVNQRWLPLSAAGLTAYTYYNDWQDGRPGYFLFEGGSLYKIDKFEVKTAPEYSAFVLEKLRDDRYPEVYLRAEHPSEQSAA